MLFAAEGFPDQFSSFIFNSVNTANNLVHSKEYVYRCCLKISVYCDFLVSQTSCLLCLCLVPTFCCWHCSYWCPSVRQTRFLKGSINTKCIFRINCVHTGTTLRFTFGVAIWHIWWGDLWLEQFLVPWNIRGRIIWHTCYRQMCVINLPIAWSVRVKWTRAILIFTSVPHDLNFLKTWKAECV
jgi:hypothetical protein